MRVFTFAVLSVAALCGCASLPPGSAYPKTESSALAFPGQTGFGRRFERAEKEHGGASGFRLLPMGVDGLLTRAQMINAAERTLDLQYFIFKGDQTGLLLADALLRAADRGVRVRVLIDDGETESGDEQIKALDAHPNIEIRVFNPFLHRGPAKLARFVEFVFNKSRLDYRMHNKLFVADNAIALVGGRNLGDEYFQIDPDRQFGDDDVFAVGPIVRGMSATFDNFWKCDLAIPIRALPGGEHSKGEMDEYRKSLNEHRKQLKASGVEYAARIATGEPLAGMISGRLPLVWAPAQLVYDSPEKRRVQRGEMLGRLMHREVAETAARTQNELLMVSPYFIPGKHGMQLLHDLRSRGVRVLILTNSLMSTNVLMAHTAYMHYREPLLDDGAELYEIRSLLGNARGSGQTERMSSYGNYGLHAKFFVFDRQRVYIGSMNFDPRSESLNTELGVIIDSPALAQQSAARFEAMARPENSYALALREHAAGEAPQLLWRTSENGKAVEYTTEPARDRQQRIRSSLMSLMPLDREL